MGVLRVLFVWNSTVKIPLTAGGSILMRKFRRRVVVIILFISGVTLVLP